MYMNDLRMTRRGLLGTAMLAGLSHHAAFAAGKEAIPVRFGIGAPVLIDTTAPYASVPEAMGYWSSEGLKVTPTPTQGATQSVQLVLAGKLDITNGGSSSFYQAILKAPEMRVVSLAAKNIWQISVLNGSPVKTIKELVGKTIGVQSFSSASYLFGRAAVSASGMNPDHDVKWLPVGVGSQAAQALKVGDVAAYATYDGPNGVIGHILGMQLRNLPTPLDKVLGLLGYASTKKYMDEHRGALVKFLRGTYEGAVFANANPAAALQIQWMKYPEQRPKAGSLDEALKIALPGVETRFAGAAAPGPEGLIGSINMDAVQQSIDFMVKYGILSEHLDAKKVVDLSANVDANKFDKAAIISTAKAWKPS